MITTSRWYLGWLSHTLLRHLFEIPIRWINAVAWALHYERVLSFSSRMDLSLRLCRHILLLQLVINRFHLSISIFLLVLSWPILCDRELTFEFGWTGSSKNGCSWISALRLAWFILQTMITGLLNLDFRVATSPGCIASFFKWRPARLAHIVRAWLGDINGVKSSLESAGLQWGRGCAHNPSHSLSSLVIKLLQWILSFKLSACLCTNGLVYYAFAAFIASDWSGGTDSAACSEGWDFRLYVLVLCATIRWAPAFATLGWSRQRT